jgi:hypothetical protein
MEYDIQNARIRNERRTPKMEVPTRDEFNDAFTEFAWRTLGSPVEDVVVDGEDAPAPLVPMMPRDTGK